MIELFKIVKAKNSFGYWPESCFLDFEKKKRKIRTYSFTGHLIIPSFTERQYR